MTADLTPHRPQRETHRLTAGELQAEFRRMTPIDSARWRRERAEADVVFGPDDPVEDPWSRRRHDSTM